MAVNSRTSFLYVAGVHVAVILAMALSGAFKGCTKKKHKPEILAVVGIEPLANLQPAPTSPTPPPPEERAVEPPPEPPPPKPPPPPPKPKPKLNTADQIREKIKNQKKVKRVFKKEVTEEKQKPEPDPTPPPKVPSEEELRKRLLKNRKLFDPRQAQGQATNQAAIDQKMALILARLKNMVDAQWQKPAGLSSSAGRICSITFTLSRSGHVIKRAYKQRSGIPELDLSAMSAAETIAFVEAFPAADRRSQEDFTIEFELTK